jgi:hypothetical protein
MINWNTNIATRGSKNQTKNTQEVPDTITNKGNTRTRNVSFKSNEMVAKSRSEYQNGGKEASTNDWLSQIENKKDLKTKCPSSSPIVSRRSVSLPRWSIERSPSPIHKAWNPSTNSNTNRITSTPTTAPKFVEKEIQFPTFKKTSLLRVKPHSSQDIKQSKISNGSVEETEKQDDLENTSVNGKENVTENENMNTKNLVKNIIRKPIITLLGKKKEVNQGLVKHNMKTISQNYKNCHTSHRDLKSQPKSVFNESNSMTAGHEKSDTKSYHDSAEKIVVSQTQSLRQENEQISNTCEKSDIGKTKLEALERSKELRTQKDDTTPNKGKILCKLFSPCDMHLNFTPGQIGKYLTEGNITHH